MKRLVLALFCLLIAAAGSGQTRRRAAESDPSQPPSRTPVRGPWLVEITSTGGIAGAGAGDMRVDSTGTLVVGQFVPYGKQCQFILPQSERDAIEAAVLSVRADLWFESFVPAVDNARCCDLFDYKVRLERQEKFAYDNHVAKVGYSTELIDTSLPNVPTDLQSFFELLYRYPDGLRARYAPACR